MRLFHCLLVLMVVGCEGSSKGYQRQNGSWAWIWYDGGGRQVVLLDDARGNLKTLSNDNYAATTDNVYLRGVGLRGADPTTFKLLTFPYSKDGSQVFAGSVPIKGADPNTFQVLGGLLEPAYVTQAHSYEKIVGPFDTVPRDFPIVGSQGWGSDARSCYFGPTLVDGAAPGTFAVLNNYYAKDAKQVYFGHRTVADADVATFRVTGGMSGEDKKHRFFKWESKK